MADLKTINIEDLKFHSTVFPSVEDMKLWKSLGAEEQRALILRDVQEGLKGPAAGNSSKDTLIQEVLDETRNAI